MNARQTAKLAMYRAVQLFCNNNLSVVNSNLAFKTAFALFILKIAGLQSSQTVVSKQTKGIAKDKKALKKTLAQIATEIAGYVFAYATDINNQTLQKQVDYSQTDIVKIKAELIVPACKNIYQAASDNLAALADYGVTAALLANFQTAMDDFSGESPKPKVAKSTKQTENVNIAQTIRDVDNILNKKMDKLVVIFKAAHPDFVTTYFETRLINNPASKPKKKANKKEEPKNYNPE